MVQAVVLAGGVGSRLHPLTRVVPKPLIPFAGSPLVEYIVDKLLREGFKEVIVTAKYLGEQIVEYFKKKPDVKPLLLNSKDTADAVRLVADHLKADFIVSMGDVVTDTPFNQFFKAHRDKGVLASIALKQVDNPLPYGLVYVDENGFISLFTEKPRSLEVYLLTLAHYRVKGSSLYSNLVNAGIYAFKKEILDILASNQGLMDFGRHVFPYLLEAGYRIYGWIAPENTYWNDIGRPS
ncbi:MAG: nucleotidyltransferase family protein, partial [Desulfurococcaceae archaeon]